MTEASGITSLATPIVFLVFNRPELTAVSFDMIRRQRPSRLHVVADGPRMDRPEDEEACRQVRAIVDDVDWPCRVTRDYADSNLGLRLRVSSGLDGAFDQLERAIVLEDDCVPTDEFFSFAQEMLDRYADDERVALVTGDNFQDGQVRGDGSYYFSKYAHIWGWATWARAWDHYDVDMAWWPNLQTDKRWTELHQEPSERRYWSKIFDRVKDGHISTWDYQWLGSVWATGPGLTVTPNANLVSNIGFGPGATNTTGDQAHMTKVTGELGPIRHPTRVAVHREADRYAFDNAFGGAARRRRRQPLGFLAWGWSAFRRRAVRGIG